MFIREGSTPGLGRRMSFFQKKKKKREKEKRKKYCIVLSKYVCSLQSACTSSARRGRSSFSFTSAWMLATGQWPQWLPAHRPGHSRAPELALSLRLNSPQSWPDDFLACTGNPGQGDWMASVLTSWTSIPIAQCLQGPTAKYLHSHPCTKPPDAQSYGM